MNTYPDGAVGIDLQALATELDRSRFVQNEAERKLIMQRISIEAQIDIATSLRVLAEEASAAMGEIPDFHAPTPAAEEVPAHRDFLVVGDMVHILDGSEVFEVLRVGVSEDEKWAEIDDGGVVRYWQRNLVRLTGDEGDRPDPLAEVVIESESAPIVAEGIAEDLDDEFEGDDFTASESALERLKRLEKKPAKKAAVKKEKKS